MKERFNLRFLMTMLLGIFMSVNVMAQNIDVRGHVKDSNGEPVIGATVRVGDTGTVTDINGDFTIKAQSGSTLQISYVGYKTVEVAANASVNVTMIDDSHLLKEAVVIGYGSVKKSDLTGSVTAIKPDDMNKGLVTSMQDALQGRVAGVNVVGDGGKPGAGATIRIRGGSSLNASNDPLIVIDGLAMDNYGVEGLSNPMSMVNPADIESFTVLKDASATAIYGSRASNGVIIITTKKGRTNQKPSISYNGNISISAKKKTIDVMSGDQYVDYVKGVFMQSKGYDEDAWLNSSEYKNLGYWTADGQHLFANTDWQDEIFRTAVSTDHNISIAGGIKNWPYRVSLGYTDQNGIVKTSNYQRFTASVNLNPTFLQEHLNVNVNAKYMHAKTTYADEGCAIGNAISMDPTKPVYGNVTKDADMYDRYFGGYYQYTSGATHDENPEWVYGPNTLAPINPVSALNMYSNKGKSNTFIGNLEADYKIHGFEDLHIHVNGGMDFSGGKSNKTHDRFAMNNKNNYYYGNDGWNDMQTRNLSLSLYAQYIKDLADVHHLDVMAGHEFQLNHKETDWFYCGYYPIHDPITDTYFDGEEYNAPDPTTVTKYKTENKLESWFGRINYNYAEKYYLTFTLRDDISSRFAKGNRAGIFPSLALAWRINNENFLKNTKVSDLKLRLGWGKTGQQDGIGDYIWIPAYTPTKSHAFYPILGDGTTYRMDAYNSDLTWEKTTTWNAGIDFGLDNNRFTTNLDFYYRKTTDLINNITVPVLSNPQNMVNMNIGELHNVGVEANFNYRVIQSNDWTWTLGYNVAWNKNEIDKLALSDDPNYRVWYGGVPVGDSSTDGIKAYHVGNATSAYYVYQQVYDENGLPIQGLYVDRNADGVINDNDRYYYKKADPDVTMGLTSKLIFKNWDFSFAMRAALNNYAYNAVEAGNSSMSSANFYSGSAYHNLLNNCVAKNWQAQGASDVLSDYFIQNASFLKMDHITLGYSFAKLFGAPISGRVYGTVQNVFTITKYDGIDPEVSGGYDGNIYPRPFVGIFGLSLNF